MNCDISVPETLHELLDQALNDIEAKQKEPGVFIDMELWHEPVGTKCFMCLAGAWLERGIDRNQKVSLEFFDNASDSVANACYALNELRRGHIYDAIIEFYGSRSNCKSLQREITVFSPRYSFTFWLKEMREIQGKLKEHNL